jgi:hypothetical protein
MTLTVSLLPNNRDVTTPSGLTNLANSDFGGLKLAENRRNRPRTWLTVGGVLLALMFILSGCDNPFEERQSCPYQKCPDGEVNR